MRKFLFLFLILAGALFAFTRLTAPPRQLDLIDHFWPGNDAATERVAEAVTFDAAGLYLTGVDYDAHWGLPAFQSRMLTPPETLS